MRKRSLAVGVLVACALLGAIRASTSACDRWKSPLEDAAVAAAVADVVAVVEVTAVGGGSATAVVKAPLKGTAKTGDVVVIQGLLGQSEQRTECDSAVDVGKSYVVDLWAPIAGATRCHVVEPAVPTILNSPAVQAATAAAVAKRHPASAWMASAPQVETRLVLAPDPPKGEVDLFILARNVGTTPIEFTDRNWPLPVQSMCSLRITDAAGKAVAAQDVPISKQDIAAYFSKFGRVWKMKIEPGESHWIYLRRVTTAVQGWGYKEDLGFKYYPVTKHGRHSVSAECVNFFGSNSRLTTSAITIDL
jgi:hypothetical protein